MWKSIGLVFFLAWINGCAATPDSGGVGDKFGVISKEALLAQYPGFAAEYQAYQGSEQEIDSMKTLEGKSLLVILGTWCHDSEREVPRLLKLLEQSQAKIKKLTLVGVDYNKQDPQGFYRDFELRYTATIILLDGDMELGRIVERPVASIAEDLATMQN